MLHLEIAILGPSFVLGWYSSRFARSQDIVQLRVARLSYINKCPSGALCYAHLIHDSSLNTLRDETIGLRAKLACTERRSFAWGRPHLIAARPQHATWTVNSAEATIPKTRHCLNHEEVESVSSKGVMRAPISGRSKGNWEPGIIGSGREIAGLKVYN